jgi:hypothetical protein
LLLGKPVPGRSTLPSRAGSPADGAPTPETLLDDLRGRLARARATPPGPRRGALLVALRYRIAVERSNGSAADLAIIEAQALELERSPN